MGACSRCGRIFTLGQVDRRNRALFARTISAHVIPSDEILRSFLAALENILRRPSPRIWSGQYEKTEDDAANHWIEYYNNVICGGKKPDHDKVRSS